MKTICRLIIMLALVSSPNIQAQWIPFNPGTTNDFNEVFFPSENIGYILPYHGSLFRTLDGGNTWDSISSIMLSAHWPVNNSLWFTSDSIGYITTDRTVFKTTDMGLTWNDISPSGVSEAFGIKDIRFINELKGYFYSYRITEGDLWTTDDGGLSWTSKLLTYPVGSGTGSLPAILFNDDSIGYYVGGDGTFMYRGVVAKTIDAGETWTFDTFPEYSLINSIDFPSRDTGYFITRYKEVYRTTNAGNDWELLSFPWLSTVNPENKIHFVNVDTGYVILDNLIYKTTNAGETWEVDFTGEEGDRFNSIYFTSGAGYVVGNNGLVLKNDFGTNRSSVIPDSFRVNIFPNPSTGKFHFTTQNLTGNRQMEIINLTGQVVLAFDLTNEEFSVDLKHYPAGVYFYRIRENRSTSTGKLIKY